ncbi:MAG: hypothetical protein ABWW69_02105 [Pyrodictiaceae archaeon]
MAVKSLIEAIEELRTLIEAIRAGEYCCLRYGLPYIKVSDIMMLYYCGAKLDFAMRLGREEGQRARLRELRVLAEALLRAKGRISEAACSKGFVSIPLAAIVEGIPIIGRPDSIMIEKCRVKSLIWLNMTKNVRRIREWHRVRMYLLGLIADYSPLPVDNDVDLYIVNFSSTLAARKALQQLREGEGAGCGDDYCVIRLVYDRGVALGSTGGILRYWVDETIKPIPRPASTKCSLCEFRNICPYAVQRGGEEGG